MKTTATNTSRNRSRGPRRGRRGGRSNQHGPAKTAPAKPKSFWERILAFFGAGGSKPKTSPVASKTATTANTSRAKSTGSPNRDSAPASAGAGRPERSKRTPEAVEVTSARLYVGNLNFDAGESDLLELFNGVGQVQYAEVVSNPHTHRSKGFAFVQMQTIEEAKRAVRELHNKDFMGRPLWVSGAKSQREEESAQAS